MATVKPPLTLGQCERALKLKAPEWAGRCYEIASQLHAAGLVTGRVVYGHYLGLVDQKSSLYRPGSPFYRHGWIVTDEDSGAVFDPTRWVFEAQRPYLFTGTPPDPVAPICDNCQLLEEEHGTVDDACDEFTVEPWPYDEGGNRLLEQRVRPFPSKGKEPTPVQLKLTAGVLKRLGIPAGALTRAQMYWIANLPYHWLGADAPAVFKALEKAGHGAAIPIDNARRADFEREEKRKKR